jgi:hypothetical protein
MPGRRSDGRERADHARDVAQRVRSLYAMLTTQLPLHERALIGRHAILDYLHTTLLLRRPNGGPVTWRMVLRWRRDHGFPLVRGAWRPRYLTPPLTTSHALTAWTLAQFDTDHVLLFRVGQGTRPIGCSAQEAGSLSPTWC